MPTVGMRRSTRIFVPKSVLKGSGGGGGDEDEQARVLRSGKRLWSVSGDVKPGKGSEEEWFPLADSGDEQARVLRSGKRLWSVSGDVKLPGKGSEDEWFPLVVDSGSDDDLPLCKSNGWRKIIQKRRNLSVKRFRRKLVVELPEEKVNVNVNGESPKDKMFGNGYGRKRSSSRTASSLLPVFEDREAMEDRMYGIQYLRKQRRTTTVSSSIGIEKVDSECEVLAGKCSSDLGKNEESLSSVHRAAKFEVFVKPSHDSASLFASFLASLVNFMRRSSVRLSQLQAFMSSEPIASVFSQHGVRFSNLSSMISPKTPFGNCKIFGARQFVPLISLNFSAAPFSFMNLHFRLFLRSQHQLYVLVRYLMGLMKDAHQIMGSNEISQSFNRTMVSGGSPMKRKGMHFVHRSVAASVRSLSARLNLNSRSIRKRSSLRRVKRPSMFLRNGFRYSNGFNFIKSNFTGDNIQSTEDNDDLLGNGNENGCSLVSILESDNKKKKLLQAGLSNIREYRNIDSLSCRSNLLVVEPDRCSREAGATITLECSSSHDWCLVVKIQGLTRFMIKAEDAMRPSTTNRFTHAMIWIDRNGWKLEFSNRRDWFIFKELYRECVDRNIYAVPPREVPIPGVHEVPFHGDMECVPFVRPNAYIKMHDDEVARVLLRRTSTYEVDSGDEEWLEKLNSSLRDGPNELVSNDHFEEMIDVFEKTSYCTPDDVSNENRAIRLCSDLRTDIVAAVYRYWVNKRKLKHSPLLRVFQSAPPRKHLVLHKPFLRKRRSFKRQASKYGRDHKRTFLQAFAEEQDQDAKHRVEESNEEQDQDAKHRVEESKNSASIAVDLAILKRKKAQALMENAELATYKANMALKIAEASKFGVSSDPFVSFILGYDSKSTENN